MPGQGVPAETQLENRLGSAFRVAGWMVWLTFRAVGWTDGLMLGWMGRAGGLDGWLVGRPDVRLKCLLADRVWEVTDGLSPRVKSVAGFQVV